MKNIEFYTFEDEVWYSTPEKKNEQLTEESRDVICFMNNQIKELYPEAYQKLNKLFDKLSFSPRLHQYRIVKRFCKCNFGEIYQSAHDIDSKGRFHFEKVACPLRGECEMENIVCNPKFNARISDSEMRVLELVYRGLSDAQIADKLCLSEHTVKNHKRNAYTRLGFHEKAEFIDYAHVNNLFKED